MKAPMVSAFVGPAGGTDEPASSLDLRTAAAPAASSRATLALARLQATRQALRLELLPPAAPQDGADAPEAGHGLSLHRVWRRLRRWARGWAPGSVLVEAVEQTWRAHPLRPVGVAIAESYRTQVAPAFRRHPWAMVAVAAGLGAALVLGRRWHAPLMASTLRPLPRRLGRWLLVQLASAPVQTALAGWLMMRAASARTEADSDAAASSDAESLAAVHARGGPLPP